MDYTELGDVLRDDAAGREITVFPDDSIEMCYNTEIQTSTIVNTAA